MPIFPALGKLKAEGSAVPGYPQLCYESEASLSQKPKGKKRKEITTGKAVQKEAGNQGEAKQRS